MCFGSCEANRWFSLSQLLMENRTAQATVVPAAISKTLIMVPVSAKFQTKTSHGHAYGVAFQVSSFFVSSREWSASLLRSFFLNCLISRNEGLLVHDGDLVVSLKQINYCRFHLV
jgi:hypothetical protein